MEDIVPETESKDHDDQEEGVGEKSSSGLLNHLLPRVVCGKESEEEKEDEIEEKRGRILSHPVTNLVSPLSPKARQHGFSVSKSEDQDVASHGGIMNNLISYLFHHSEYGKNGDDESDEIEESSEKKKVDKGTEKEAAEEESGVVGIIDNIVSHFPTSILDDAVPTTDEASILIHTPLSKTSSRNLFVTYFMGSFFSLKVLFLHFKISVFGFGLSIFLFSLSYFHVHVTLSGHLMC